MCLKLKSISFKRLALTDKICYKFLESDCKGGYETPYRYLEVTIGETYKSTLRRTECNEIEEGLHSFANYEDTKRKADNFSCVVAKCVIPRGSWYYKGEFSGYKSYASNQLKYVEIIKN